VQAVQAAAERLGYIVAASNNSRNGPVPGSAAAANAVWQDTHERFPVDERRRYLGGMSDGARVATAIALSYGGCAAGVIATAAGFHRAWAYAMMSDKKGMLAELRLALAAACTKARRSSLLSVKVVRDRRSSRRGSGVEAGD
jgi:poly(3-hydroxybutyrate) depolymerase